LAKLDSSTLGWSVAVLIESESTQQVFKNRAQNICGSGSAVASSGILSGARRAGIEIIGELHEFLERLLVGRGLCRGATLVGHGTE
jgi:hypothetical protein